MREGELSAEAVTGPLAEPCGSGRRRARRGLRGWQHAGPGPAQGQTSQAAPVVGEGTLAQALAEPGGTHPPRAQPQPQPQPLTPGCGDSAVPDPATQSQVVARDPVCRPSQGARSGPELPPAPGCSGAGTVHAHFRPQRRTGRAWLGPCGAEVLLRGPAHRPPPQAAHGGCWAPRSCGHRTQGLRPCGPGRALPEAGRVSLGRQELPVAEGRGWTRAAGPGGVPGD